MKRRTWRILGIVAAAVLIPGACAGGLAYAFFQKFYPDPPDARYPKPATALEAQRQNLDYFGRLIAMDGSFSAASRDAAGRRLAQLSAGSTVLDHAHLRTALMEIAALADNGHTGINSKKPVRPKILPIRLTAFGDELYVMRAEKRNADLLGGRVTAIDGHPIAEVLARMERHFGGTKAWRLAYAQWMINSSELLYGMGIAPSTDRSVWTVRTRNGATVARSLAGYRPDYDEPAPDIWRWMSPLPVKGDKHDWAVFAPAGRKLPLTLQDANRVFRLVRIPGTCAALLQLKANSDTDGQRIGDFLKTAERDLAAVRPCALIFDNRFNGGGDYTTTASFASHLPGLVANHGKIYLLTGPNTFSAGITTTVFVKQAADPGQVVILGEPVGDRLVFWAEGARGCLPHAPFCFHYATGMHDYAHPCTDWSKCFWLNWIYPARTDSLAPAETIAMSYEDFLAGRDPAFDRALARAAR